GELDARAVAGAPARLAHELAPPPVAGGRRVLRRRAHRAARPAVAGIRVRVHAGLVALERPRGADHLTAPRGAHLVVRARGAARTAGPRGARAVGASGVRAREPRVADDVAGAAAAGSATELGARAGSVALAAVARLRREIHAGARTELALAPAADRARSV